RADGSARRRGLHASPTRRSSDLLRLQDVDIREAVRAMVDLYSPTTTTHRVVVKVPDEPVIVRADALRLEQVVSNLLSNAIKYSRSEEHTSELQSRENLVCRLLLE